MVLQKCPAIFIIGIGWTLKDGYPHEMRAADYDDWVTDTKPETGRPTHGLNGDIRFGTNVTRRRHELSSMGIRVDRASLWRRLELTGQLEFDASVAEGAPGRGQRQRLAKSPQRDVRGAKYSRTGVRHSES